MSKDFVRRLPDAGLTFEKRHSLFDVVHVDLVLLILLVIISSYGLIVLNSALGPQEGALSSQMVKFLIATVIMLFMAQISPVTYMRFAPWLYGLVLFLLVAVLLFGSVVNGSQRWLRVPGIGGFQPSELVKIVVPLVLAWYFHDRHLPPRLKHIAWALLIVIIPVVLIARQPDLGTSLLIGASGVIVLLLAGISWRFVIGAVGACLAAAPGLWMVMREYQKERVLTLFNPERDPLGSGWNIIQSKTAIGSGGVFGKGLSQGTQSQLDFLPERQTDFIIAVLGEELGLIGIIALLILYLLVIGRGIIIAIEAQDTFGRLLAGTITFTFFVYIFVNIGMVVGLLPVVGVPLPMVSAGGTSIVSLFAGFGILMSIHTHRRIML